MLVCILNDNPFLNLLNIIYYCEISFIGVSLGSLLGGYIYALCGGIVTFRIFAYGSALACLIHLICQNFLKSNGKLGFPSK